MYIQPKMEISNVAPTTVVCTSGEYGGTTSQLGGGEHTADAPKRRTEVF